MKRLFILLSIFLSMTATHAQEVSVSLGAQQFSVGRCLFEVISEEAGSVRILRGDDDETENGRSSAVIPSSAAYQGIDYTVVEIGKDAYSGRKANVITLPSTIKRVCDEAFMYCSYTEKINLPEGLESIGSRAFGCTDVDEIHIPASVRYMGHAPFMWAGNTAITVDAANPYYDSREDCNAIIETETNTLIQGSAYTRIPESVTTIGVNAFGCYHGLESIDIPESVTALNDSAFMFCYNLERIKLSDGLKKIGNRAFMICPKLKELTLPKSVEHIGMEALYGCHSLDSFTVLATTPPEVATGQPMLPEEKFATTVLTVPEGCEKAYRKHEVWGRFKNIVERDLTAIHSPSAATKQQKVPYDLSGRRLSARPTKGLYIEDGKVRVEM